MPPCLQDKMNLSPRINYTLKIDKLLIYFYKNFETPIIEYQNSPRSSIIPKNIS